MTGAQIPSRAKLRNAWVIGGALLLATVVFAVATPPSGFLGGGFIGTALHSASLLVFAFGIRGSGSITARRPLGTAALTVLAIWTPLVLVLQMVFASGIDESGSLLWFGFIDSFVRFAAALIAVTQIARAGVVPRAWSWAPAWALVATAAVWLVGQVVAVGSGHAAQLIAIVIVGNLDGLVRIGSQVFLGVLAIVLANRPSRQQTVAVYSTPD